MEPKLTWMLILEAILMIATLVAMFFKPQLISLEEKAADFFKAIRLIISARTEVKVK